MLLRWGRRTPPLAFLNRIVLKFEIPPIKVSNEELT